MALKNTYNDHAGPVGVIGAGSFGTAVSFLLSKKREVILYARNSEVVESIKKDKVLMGFPVPANITPTNDLEMVADKCNVLFPIIPSSNFRTMMIDLAPFLHPYHIIIHGTKGLEVSLPQGESLESENISISRDNVKTMSEVIIEESVSLRVGCLAGPNLATEILQKHPAATVIASHFDEVIKIGQSLLRSDRFQVYGNEDLIGIELAGVLKNIIAIASGALSGLGYGENARSLLISRGMVEMIYLGKELGGNTQAFIGLAGIGDLIATCMSPLSRNYTVGYRLAKGEDLETIQDSMEETAEGINSVRIIKKLMERSPSRAPITEVVYKVLFGGMKVSDAVDLLMRSPFNVDISFM